MISDYDATVDLDDEQVKHLMESAEEFVGAVLKI